MAITFRALTSADLPIFIHLRMTQLQEEGAQATVDLEPALWDYYRRHLADGGFAGFVAVDGAEIVGTSGLSVVEKPPYYGNLTGRIGLLSSMYTRPAYRRQGIARSLLREAQEYAEAHDLARLTLEVRASNVPAIALYEGMGFTRDGIRPGFYDSPKEDAAIYSYYL